MTAASMDLELGEKVGRLTLYVTAGQGWWANMAAEVPDGYRVEFRFTDGPTWPGTFTNGAASISRTATDIAALHDTQHVELWCVETNGREWLRNRGRVTVQ